MIFSIKYRAINEMGIRSIGHYDLEAESLDDLASGLHFTLSEEIDLPGTLSSIYLDITQIINTEL